MIAASFAVAIGISRVAPVWSIGVVAVAVAIQLIGWAARFTQTGWVAYLMLLVLVGLLAASARGRDRTIVVIAAVPIGVAVACLLTLPSLSLSGEWGLINGQHWGSADVWVGFALCVAGGVGAAAIGWRLVTTARSRLATPRADATAASGILDSLSARERDIYLWVARGLTNAEIAAEAGIEESTVKSHVTSVLSKLGLSSRAGIVAHAYRFGILTPEPA